MGRTRTKAKRCGPQLLNTGKKTNGMSNTPKISFPRHTININVFLERFRKREASVLGNLELYARIIAIYAFHAEIIDRQASCRTHGSNLRINRRAFGTIPETGSKCSLIFGTLCTCFPCRNHRYAGFMPDAWIES